MFESRWAAFRVHLETLCEFGQRAITADGEEGYLRLNEGLWVLRVRLGMDSRRVDCIGTRSQHYTLIPAKICPIKPNHL